MNCIYVETIPAIFLHHQHYVAFIIKDGIVNFDTKMPPRHRGCMTVSAVNISGGEGELQLTLAPRAHHRL